MESVMAFYVLLYFVLGLVIYHSLFDIWYLNLGKALLKEIVGAIFFAVIMAGFTLKLWWIALIIIILIGLGLSAKVNNPTGKKIVLGVFAAVAIFTAITGIKFNKQLKDKEQAKQEQEQYSEQEQTDEQANSYSQRNTEANKQEYSNDRSEPVYSNDESVKKNDANSYDEEYEAGSLNNKWDVEDDTDMTYGEAVYTEGDPGDVLFGVKVSVSDGGVNLRSGPGTDYDILESMIPNGTELQVTDEITNQNTGKDWYYTYYNGKEGWVSASAVAVMEGADLGSDDYIIWGSDSGYVEKAYLERLSDDELRIARNEIFARHGRKFDSEDLQSYFNSKSWYKPKYDPEEFDAMQNDILNHWEKANRDTIKEVEASRK